MSSTETVTARVPARLGSPGAAADAMHRSPMLGNGPTSSRRSSAPGSARKSWREQWARAASMPCWRSTPTTLSPPSTCSSGCSRSRARCPRPSSASSAVWSTGSSPRSSRNSPIASPRPTHRPGGRLDLDRTVRANLHTLRRDPDGAPVLVPERPRFRTRARRSADWHVSIVVDVSGSMEASTIYSAVIAAILNGLPALSTRFIAFSTEVVDLTHRVDDPLGLLLEVSIGGGTNIGSGLRYVRDRLIVPSRTIVALVTDFEEGVSVGRLLAEVRALAESGAHLLGLAALNDRGQPDRRAGAWRMSRGAIRGAGR